MTPHAIKDYPIAPLVTPALTANNYGNKGNKGNKGDKSHNSILAQTLLASVAEYRTSLHGRRIWLACSGGRDSLALAAVCLQLYHQGALPFLPQLLHVDHGLQAASTSWAQHLAQWAAVQQLPCTILKADVDGIDEQAARLARYQVMRAHINQGDVLLLAHHADDQAETVLMRLIQGAGVTGLSGMQAWRVHQQAQQYSIMWRPWLSVRRDAITAYAEQLKLPYIDDPTNDAGDNVRSGLRCHVLPLLAKYNAAVIDNIARSAQLLSDAQATISAQAMQDEQECAIDHLSYPPAQRALDIERLHAVPTYRQRQLLHYWLTQDEPLPPSKQLVDDVLSLSLRDDNNHQTELDWYAEQQPYRICRYRQQLYRLSHAWLAWLHTPIDEQRHTLKDLLSNPRVSIREQSSHGYHWQLKLAIDTLQPFINSQTNYKDHLDITLKVAPLARQQRIQTTLASRPQAGKKLHQSLGIPVWLRDSLVVISVVIKDIKDIKEPHHSDEIDLFLLSPFNRWELKNRGSNIVTVEEIQTLKSSLQHHLMLES